MNLASATACMSMVAKGVHSGEFGAFGMTKADVELLTGGTYWMPDDRTQVVRTFDAAIFGVMHAQALPPLEAPAEFICAGIFAVVHPNNYFAACTWFQRGKTLDQSTGKEFDAISPRELFVILCHMHNDEACAAQASQFKKQMASRIRKAVKDE